MLPLITTDKQTLNALIHLHAMVGCGAAVVAAAAIRQTCSLSGLMQ